MEKIKRLRKILHNYKIDGYLIPKNDEFFSEYVKASVDRLKYISDFSGSYGFALILKTKSYLFVDGRYTTQANIQCGKKFIIKTLPKEMPEKVLRKKLIIGFDPRLFTKKNLEFFFKKTNAELIPFLNNFIDKIWIRKKNTGLSKLYQLPNNCIGQSVNTKLRKVVKNLNDKYADLQFITSSENNAWLLNIRGADSKYSPIPNCYILIDKKKNITFFCNKKKINFSFKKKFKNIDFIEIDKVDHYLSKIRNKKIIIDSNTCSKYFENIITKYNKIVSFNDPIYYFKSIKMKNEIDNIKRIHIEDGVALTKYLIWVKKNFHKIKITEISGEKKLLNLRKKNRNFKFPSFPSISGVGPNGAVIHYRANKSSNRNLKIGEIYLIDSGGQYFFGTTDVTRTISLNNNNQRIKNIFTRVLKGHIAVANFKLNSKTTGATLDKVARKYLKKINLNYAHGTGHGVGYFLNVHEGPQAISKNNYVPLKQGMVVSNEPGYYEKNKFGIRIENLIFIKKNKSKMVFENLTMVPIDKDLIDSAILNVKERSWLNEYHKKVLKNLGRYMDKMEFLELKKACSAI